MTSSGLDILYVGTLPPHPGGSALSGAEILKGLAADGHKVRAIGPVTPATRLAAASWDRAHPSLEVRRFEVPFFQTEPMHAVAGAYRRAEGEAVQHRLEDELAVRRPDVLFAGRETFAPHVAPVARRDGLPWLQRVAGGLVLGILEGTVPEDQSRVFLGAMAEAQRIVSPACHMGDKLASLGLTGALAIPNTIDTSRFHPGPRSGELLADWGIPPHAPVVAHISNLKAIKRPLDAVECADEVMRAVVDAIFVLIGDGPMRPDMEAAIAERCLASRSRVVGWVTYEEMPDWLRLCDVVLLPSRNDTQPRVSLETMASGAVLVASDIPALRGVADHGHSALLHPVGDVAEMARLALSGLGDSDVRERSRTTGPRVAENHSPGHTIPAYASLLREVATSGG